jgi:drug/metabolite transporter (DMT)-like permease
VNPVVALLLGWLVRGEHLTPASFGGSALVLAGVVLGLRGSAPPPAGPAPAERRA